MNYKTAIKRKAPSLPMRHLSGKNLLVGRMLDYGSGRGYDAEHFKMVKFDPHFAPERPSGKFNTIVCNYVLNVVDIPTQRQILDDIKSLLVEGGIAYVSVRRDLKTMITTCNGYNQRLVNVSGRGWSLFHEVSGKYAMYKLTKDELKRLLEDFNPNYEFTTSGAQYRKQYKLHQKINKLRGDK